jgi:GR25 family glycosyltransferase involved in LPS biosynthesis
VLALNESNIDPSANKCKHFVAPSFTEAELDFVAPEARKKILNPALLETASDLTNNGSVNIYMNHARIWRHIVKRWDVALVLEEDTVVPSNADEVITQILSVLRRDNVTNYIVKLMDSSKIQSLQWKPVYTLSDHYQVRTCTCQPSIRSSSSAAYLIDRTAAMTLLKNAFPASIHVDVFKHHMGCIDNKIRLYQVTPHLMHVNNRPTTHLPHDYRRMYLLLKEIITNAFYSTC